ncbi:MAG TPA: MFS transporter [Symbiobacteriaceae bacterium]
MKQYHSLLRNRNFVLLWLGGAISNVGDFFNSVALLKILSEDPAHLGFYLALIMIAKTLPAVLLSPVAGVLADRLPRRTMMVVSDLLRAGLVAALAFTSSPAAIVALVFLAAAVSAFFNPAHTALLPNVVAKDELVSASSLAYITQRTAQLLGNGLGAAALLVMSPHQVFFIDAASFMVSAGLTGLMVLRAVAPQAADPSLAQPDGLLGKFRYDVRETGAFLREAPVVRRLVVTFGFAAVGDAGLSVLLYTFFIAGLGLAAEHIGFVMALFGGMSVLSGLAIGALGNRVHWRHLISSGGVYIWAGLFAAIAIHRTLPSAALVITIGAGSSAVNVGAATAFGTLVPDYVRGRVAGAWSTLQNGLYVAGTLSAGYLSDRLGPIPVLMGFISTYLLMGLYAMWAFRSVEQAMAIPNSGVAD